MRIIKAFLDENLQVDCDVRVCKNLKHGDYTTNAVLKYKLDIKDLKCPDWIDHYELVGGHLNLYVSTQLQPLYQGEKKRDIKHRMKDILNRLSIEGYTEDYEILVWEQLVKSYNLLSLTYQKYGYAEKKYVDNLVDIFEKLDHGFVYRLKNHETLCAIRDLLNRIVTLLERIDYEEYL